MNRRLLIAGALVAALLGALLVATLKDGDRAHHATSETDDPGHAADSRHPTWANDDTRARPRLNTSTSRVATRADIPTTSEEARSRPETPLRESLGELRQLFARERHREVIDQASALLASAPERDQVRALLAMAYCAVGEGDQARSQAEQLPSERRGLVSRKCANVGIDL